MAGGRPVRSCAGLLRLFKVPLVSFVLLAWIALGVVPRDSAAASVPAAKADLSAEHRRWLEEEVIYIISDDERKIFLALPTEEDRTKFIERFWLDRDPTPGTPQNEYREEHYRRIDYANTFFSSSWTADGWRSDRGRIYIILGPPKSRAPYPGGGQTYPMELWFYSSSEPSLPPFFYVLFYQAYGMSDYRLYSPYVDGPTKLVRGSGTEGNRYGAYQLLREVNIELARASLSLIPSEPTDVDASPSLTSDGMLMKVINLANDKLHKERLERQRQLREEVQYRLTFDVPLLEVVTLVLRDGEGHPFVHYSMQIPEPQNYTVARHKGQYYIAVEGQVRVLDGQGKLIYEVTRDAVAYYDEKEMAARKGRPLAFEDFLPLAPGEYRLEFMLLNRIDHVYYRSTAQVKVEPTPIAGIAVGEPVLVQECGPPERANEPFTMGQMRCRVKARPEIAEGVKANLNLLYTVQVDPATVAGGRTEPLRVRYTVGRLDRSVEPSILDDTLDPSRFDPFGTLLVGKSLPLTELPPGGYRLSIQVNDPVTREHAARTFSFHLGAAPLPTANVLTPEDPLKDVRNGNVDYWRGLCAGAQGDMASAASLLSRALQFNPDHRQARVQLAELFFNRGSYDKTASLLETAAVSESADDGTVRLLLESLEKMGEIQRAIDVGERALRIIKPTAEIYQEMATLYERAGEPAKAQQAREFARRLSSPSPD